MTADGLSSTTLGSLLFGHDNEDSGALVLSPSWEDFQGSLAGFIAELAGMSRETLGREVATAISDAEDMQLGDLMIYGWRTHRHLVEAARRTLREPDTKQVVHLASQRLPLTRHPVVDLTVGGVCVYSAHFTVTVTFDVAVADAVVRQGRLTEVTVGGYSVVVVLEAELPAGNVELLRRACCSGWRSMCARSAKRSCSRSYAHGGLWAGMAAPPGQRRAGQCQLRGAGAGLHDGAVHGD